MTRYSRRALLKVGGAGLAASAFTSLATGKTVRVIPEARKHQQRFWAVDVDEVEVMARFTDGDRPSLVRRDAGKSIEYWVGSVMVPADLLRGMAREAGCHLYCDADEIIYANRSFLAVHTGVPGLRTFRLRGNSDVLDALTGETIAEDAGEFSLPIDAFATRLFFLGSAEKWNEALANAHAFHHAFQAERQLRSQRASSD